MGHVPGRVSVWPQVEAYLTSHISCEWDVLLHQFVPSVVAALFISHFWTALPRWEWLMWNVTRHVSNSRQKRENSDDFMTARPQLWISYYAHFTQIIGYARKNQATDVVNGIAFWCMAQKVTARACGLWHRDSPFSWANGFWFYSIWLVSSHNYEQLPYQINV